MSFAKSLVMFAVIVGIIAGGILYTTRQDAEYINVRVNLTQLNDTPSPRIDNLTAFLVPTTKVSEPKGNDLVTPGIVVMVFKGQEIIGSWTSVPYNGTGTYNLKVGLTEYPKQGDVVYINIRFLDPNGEELNSLTYGTTLE
ncbi:MAG: hypothetical protein O8C64_04555 [Candidatus Methanoperedens sp.]|nr:hypothetical protein [Candidatus Methanoperedens sp.]MCZ7406088.1 hypothetical protein [Candidatus Methanoperedens sp.]